MKDIREELKNLGDAVVTSLGFLAIAISVFFIIIIVMHEIYCKPPEESSERPSHGGSRGPGIAVQLITNPVHKWHPLNAHHW